MKLYKLFFMIPALLLPLSLTGCEDAGEPDATETTEEAAEATEESAEAAAEDAEEAAEEAEEQAEAAEDLE